MVVLTQNNLGLGVAAVWGMGPAESLGIAPRSRHWNGRNTSAAIVERLNTTLNEILQDADMKASMAKEGVIPSGGTALAFGQRTRDEYDRWAKVVARANIRAQPE